MGGREGAGCRGVAAVGAGGTPPDILGGELPTQPAGLPEVTLLPQRSNSCAPHAVSHHQDDKQAKLHICTRKTIHCC